jgi:hypothetical protein
VEKELFEEAPIHIDSEEPGDNTPGWTEVLSRKSQDHLEFRKYSGSIPPEALISEFDGEKDSESVKKLQILKLAIASEEFW